MQVRIDRVDTRQRLECRREPYWQSLARGRRLGFRKLTPKALGTWLARFYDGQAYQQKALGEFADKAERDRFDAAATAAAAWFSHLDAGGSSASVTVKAACEAYVAKLRLENSEAAAIDAEGRFKRLVDNDPIGRIALAKLAPRHVAEWKKRVIAGGGTRSSANRNFTGLRAALNLAKRRRDVASDSAWAEELRPFEDAGGRRTLYLERDERRKLIAEASKEVRPFLQGLALIPLRPGELAALRVSDLDVRHRMLRVPSGKTGAREIPLGGEAFDHLEACAKEKLPSAWLVARKDGGQWDRFAWRLEVKLAAAAAKLPRATVAYTLRHCAITDLVTAGADLFTIAKLSGTSIAMIEKHYGHLQREHARAALETLSLA